MRNKFFRIGMIILLLSGINNVCAQEKKGPPPPPPETKDIAPEEKIPQLVEMVSRDEEEVLQYIEANDPEGLKDIAQLKQENPKQYQNLIKERLRIIRMLNKAKAIDPEQYEQLKRLEALEIKMHRLAKSYKDSTESEKKQEVKVELTACLNEMFDIKQQKGTAEVVKLEQRLNKLKSYIQKRLDNKESIVGRKLEELLGQAEGLGW
ncbi:MAG: hypothetical protein GY853_04760 [PVC group bacterium]|nr:hypothetical protein [PVC group bacterium]